MTRDFGLELDQPGASEAALLGLLSLIPRRSEPLFGEAGLPRSIADSPTAIRELARKAVVSDRLGAHPGEVRNDRAARHRQAVVAFLSGLAEAYGEASSADVREWLRSFHIDTMERTRLQSWATVLQLMAAGSRIASAAELPQHERSVVSAVVDDLFGSDATAQVARAVRAADGIPLSEDEQKILAMETSMPGDEESWNVIQDMELNSTLARARAARTSLSQQLTREQFTQLVQWARNVLISYGNDDGASVLA